MGTLCSLKRATVRGAVLCLCLAACLRAGTVAAQEELRLTFTTTEAGGKYKPKHVHAVWIQDDGGAFVRTVALWGDKRAHNLANWFNATDDGDADIDGRTGATQRTHREYATTWDLKGRDGETVPDGAYTVRLELTDDEEKKNKVNRASFTFEKNGTAGTQTPPDQSGYQNVTIVYTGRGVIQQSPQRELIESFYLLVLGREPETGASPRASEACQNVVHTRTEPRAGGDVVRPAAHRVLGDLAGSAHLLHAPDHFVDRQGHGLPGASLYFGEKAS